MNRDALYAALDTYLAALDAGDAPPGRFPTTNAAQLPPLQRRSSTVYIAQQSDAPISIPSPRIVIPCAEKLSMARLPIPSATSISP